MAHPASVAQEISLFRFRVQNRWFDDVTFRVLESILVCKDVQSLVGVRSVLKQFMRDESLLIFGEIREERIEIKLLYTELSSFLALRYEALVMRDERANSLPVLHVLVRNGSVPLSIHLEMDSPCHCKSGM